MAPDQEEQTNEETKEETKEEKFVLEIVTEQPKPGEGVENVEERVLQEQETGGFVDGGVIETRDPELMTKEQFQETLHDLSDNPEDYDSRGNNR